MAERVRAREIAVPSEDALPSAHSRVANPLAEPAVQTSWASAKHSPNWSALAAVVAIHLALLALVGTGNIAMTRTNPAPLVVNLIPLDPPPEPETRRALPSRIDPVVKRPEPQLHAPAPIIKTAVQTAPIPAAIAAPAPPVSSPAPVGEMMAPVSTAASNDLSLNLIFAPSPAYPVASRRNREQGVVILDVTLGEDGRVAEISVMRSSGHDRLDRAALTAVRRWRWTPSVVEGKTTRVRGLVRVPFELRD